MNKKDKKQDPTDQNRLRSIPSVDVLLRHESLSGSIARHGLTLTKTFLKSSVSELRSRLQQGKPCEIETESIIRDCLKRLEMSLQPILRRAVNATGIILHTGLGRAPLPESAVEKLSNCAKFCNLQTDLDSGRRSRREANLLDHVKSLTGAEDAIAVNNNAGATMLVLKALAKGREVIVSRGELIEIGGSFRLPDIMAESGAILKEVGSTNKTHAKDYEKAINEKTAVLFKAHKSNYSIVGFTKETDIAAIAEIGHKHGVTVVDDLGCGALIDTRKYGLPHEVTVRESLEAGADIVLFSTDKLIGGPQGGMIAGKKTLIDIIRKDPLYRVLRICKLTLSALEGTLKVFTQPETLDRDHPLYRALSRTQAEIKAQADRVVSSIQALHPDWTVTSLETVSILGGGSLPGSELPSYGVSITSKTQSAETLASAFRKAPTPVFGRIEKDLLILDMRTVEADDEIKLLETASLL